ncbi:MAG: hypothetical protein AMXMBFR57_37420 [Acidimicrobiia bacterium]
MLLVDDDPTFVRFVCRALEKLGVRPDVALTGQDALRRFETGQWAGVLLDLRLPDIGGLEVLRRMRDAGRPEPVIVLTGAGDVPAAVAAMKLGALDFVEKPLIGSMLEMVVEQLLTNGSDRPTDRQDSLVAQLPGRTLRLASVVVRFVETRSDARTVDGFCRAVGLYKSPRTFRGWSQAEGVEAAALHDLARVLRAARQAAADGYRLAECLEGDSRSIRALLVRGFGTPEGPTSAASVPTPVEILRAQRYLSAPRLVEAILLLLSAPIPDFPRS